MIKQDFIDKVLNQETIDKVIGDLIPLKRAGANLSAKSPFTKEKTGSLMVSPAKNIWKDFSSGLGGGAVNFVMEYKNLTFPEAIKFLADKYSWQVEYDNDNKVSTKEYKEKLEKKEELRKVLKAVHSFYIQEYKKLPEDHAAKIEVKGRGYTDNDIIEWGIGFAPKNVLYKNLIDKGWVEPAKELGLINDRNNDRYGDRVIYPIYDESHNIIGLAGRNIAPATENYKPGKWINSSETLLYNKSYVFFAFEKARQAIRKKGKMYIVEGYNDVIGMHKVNVYNTISPCGTSITTQQIQIIKKNSISVVLALDPDFGGEKATIKYVEELLRNNTRCEILNLTKDPDDYIRDNQDVFKEFISNEIKKTKIIYKQKIADGFDKVTIVKKFRYEIQRIYDNFFEIYIQENKLIEDGFSFLMREKLNGTEIEKQAAARELAILASNLQNDDMKIIYLEWLSKTAKIKVTTINKWIADNKKNSRIIEYNEDYELPKEVTIPFSELEKDIKKFGIFMANNKTWIVSNPASEDKKYFKSISNFEIEILQHLADEKYPAYLTRMKNVEGKEVVFDCNSTVFNALIRFKDELTRFRNFIFTGKNDELEKLFHFLSEKSGSGAKVEVLGWQYDGEFWAWNNLVVKDENTFLLDANGRYVQGKDHYYLPSANIVYAKNRNKFKNQKEFLHLENNHDFYKILLTTAKVHRHHYISPLLFTIACMFRDIVVDKLNHFPILFLYGRAGTGKDELARMLMSFYGKTRITTSLESNSSTQKANLRMLAQIRNGIAMMSEYKTGNPGLDGALKGIYDNLGYNIGTMESKISTDTIPIESGVILTGNYFPDAEALIQRVIWNQMDKDIFNEDEKENMRAWQEMIKDTLSSHTTMLLKKRKLVEDKFLETHSFWNKTLTNLFPDVKTRMLDNLAIISSFYDIFKDVIRFPFSEIELLEHYKVGLDQQMYRLNANSLIAKFWECFVISFEGMPTKRIEIGSNIKIENKGNSLSMFVRWTAVHAIISERWYVHFKEAAPKKDLLLEEIKKIPGLFIDNHSTYRFSPGRDGIKSSAIELNIKNLQANVINDIIGAYQKQSYSQPALFEAGLSSLYVNDSESPEEIQKEIETQKQINDPEMPF